MDAASIAQLVSDPAEICGATFATVPLALALMERLALAEPQRMVTVPAVLAAVTLTPLIEARLASLLVHVPSGAEAGTGLILAVPEKLSADGVSTMPVRVTPCASGVTVVETADDMPVPLAFAAMTTQVYVVPLAKPVTTRGLAAPLAVQ